MRLPWRWRQYATTNFWYLYKLLIYTALYPGRLPRSSEEMWQPLISPFVHSLLGPNGVSCCCVEDNPTRTVTYSKWDFMIKLLLRKKQTEIDTSVHIYIHWCVIVYYFRILFYLTLMLCSPQEIYTRWYDVVAIKSQSSLPYTTDLKVKSHPALATNTHTHTHTRLSHKPA
jgi:hypothetical protein